MKRFATVFIALCLLMGCSNTPIQPSVIPTSPSTETPTTIPTRTPTQTSTSSPTATVTSTPSLPNTIEFTFDKSISEKAQNDLKEVVNQAYWFYIGLGCAPDGFKAKFYDGEGGYADYVNGKVQMEAGVASLETDRNKTTNGISHELAHTMCQLPFTKPKAGQFGSMDMRWLTEAFANYFSTWERITNTGSDFGYKTIAEWETSMAYNGSSKYCGFSIALLEASNADKKYKDQYFSAGHTATVLLAKTTPDGISALLNYYKFLNKESAAKAFQEAFGRTKEEFYKQYQSECDQGFPTLTLLPPSEGNVRLKGNLVFTDRDQAFAKYMITFCNIKNIQCGPSTTFQKDGTFLIDLVAGAYYKASINPADGGEPIGWYNSEGLVENNTCAGLIQTKENMEITITIDPNNVRQCK